MFHRARVPAAQLRGVLGDYPRASLLLELAQNADDARARRLAFLLDRRGTGRDDGASSAAAPEGVAPCMLSRWRGGALLAWNDATFSDGDLASITRVGDSVKRAEKGGAAKTGRFGVGFCATYHVTDTPGFVTGSKFVEFDPHATHLPNVDPGNPGKAFDFVKNRAARHEAQGVPALLAPFDAFGAADAALRGKPYAGTLFRFPLRTAAQAKTSRLSAQPCTPRDAGRLLDAAAESAATTLLFLKSIEEISTWVWDDGDAAPRRVSCTSLQRPSADLRAARSLLMTTAPPEGPFPRSPGLSAVPPLQRSGATKAGARLGSGKGAPYCADYTVAIVSEASDEAKLGGDGDGDGSAGAGGAGGAGGDGADGGGAGGSGGGARRVTAQWLVCNQLGGGRASELGADPRAELLRLVPWGGVAVRIGAWVPGDAGEEAPEYGPLSGSASCFLPLPVATALPVHVNAFFQLSSNRRDIWGGADTSSGTAAALTTGDTPVADDRSLDDGAVMRGAWNAALLRDVVAPCWARAIVRCAQLAERALASAPDAGVVMKRLWALWPRGVPRQPWMTAARATLALLSTARILPCGAGAARAGWQFVSPKDAILCDPASEGDDDDGHEHAVGAALLQDGVPVVYAPDGVAEALRNGSLCTRMSTALVREHLRRLGARAACLKDRATVLRLLRYVIADMPGGLPGRSRGRGDVDAAELVGLPLVPLGDAALGVFGPALRVDESHLASVMSLGFARGAAAAALVTVAKQRGDGDVVSRAAAWLFEHEGAAAPQEGGDVGAVWYVTTPAQRSLLLRQRAALVDVPESDEHLSRFLASEPVRAATNVQLMVRRRRRVH